MAPEPPGTWPAMRVVDDGDTGPQPGLPDRRKNTENGQTPQPEPARRSTASDASRCTVERLSAPISQTNRADGRTGLQAFDGVGGVARAELLLDTGHDDGRRRSQNGGPQSRRSLNGAMPATGLSGFCGATIHQTSSRPRCSRASRLMNRWPSWAGLNEPPSRPIRRPAAWFSNGRWAVRAWFVRCRARRISWS